MESIILKDEEGLEYSEVKMKARALLINSEGKIVVSNYGGTYLLPGGTIDEGEDPNDTIIRELKEELGVDLHIEDLTPLAKIKYYQANYPSRKGKNVNKISITYFYTGKIDKIYENNKLTESEKEQRFYSDFYSIEEIEEMIKEKKEENSRKKFFDKELKTIIDLYKEKEEKGKMNER